MTNPETYDGRPSAPFNVWWKSVTKYLSFYPETNDQQKIAWVGTLLTGTAKAWDLHRYDTLGENDTWANYAAAIRTEYHDPWEAANAQLKLGHLKYAGDIRAYLTEFRALNNYARVMGESLQEKVNLAMPDSVLDMRFAHYLGEFVDDEGFLEATSQAALQVELKKALKVAKEATRAAPAPATRKDDRDKGHRRVEDRNPRPQEGNQGTRKDEFRPHGKDSWGTTGAALKGVPQAEVDVHKKDRDNCWRCGRPGHGTYDCYAGTTTAGTALPKAPWKVSAVDTAGPVTAPKRKREEEESSAVQPSKLQKVAAVDATEPTNLCADSEDSDF